MYDITITMLIKTMGISMTHRQMQQVIWDAISDHPQIRDVLIVKYDGNTLPDKPFGDIENLVETIRNENQPS